MSSCAAAVARVARRLRSAYSRRAVCLAMSLMVLLPLGLATATLDNRSLGDKETGGRVALPIFREIMLRTYQLELVGVAPSFPREIEDAIDQYLVGKR
jgi:hypothetical protein